MSSSLPSCNRGNLLNSTDLLTHYVTDWSNCTLGNCFDQYKYRIPYVGCCSDRSGNLSSTRSVHRECWMKTGDMETSPCDTDTWNHCTREARSKHPLISWTPWRNEVEWYNRKPQDITKTFRVGWPVELSRSIQRVRFFKENQTHPAQPETQPEWDSVGIYTGVGILIFLLVLAFCVVTRILYKRHKHKEAYRRILEIQRIIRRRRDRNEYSEYSFANSGAVLSDFTLQNTTINTINLPPTYDEAIMSDNGNVSTVPRTTTTTIIRTTTTEVNPISLSSANAIVNGIPPPSYDMLFETGARPADLPENERPPAYSISNFSLFRPVHLPGYERPLSNSNLSSPFSLRARLEGNETPPSNTNVSNSFSLPAVLEGNERPPSINSNLSYPFSLRARLEGNETPPSNTNVSNSFSLRANLEGNERPPSINSNLSYPFSLRARLEGNETPPSNTNVSNSFSLRADLEGNERPPSINSNVSNSFSLRADLEGNQRPPSNSNLSNSFSNPVYLSENERPPSYPNASDSCSLPVDLPGNEMTPSDSNLSRLAIVPSYANSSNSFIDQVNTADFMLF